MIQDIIAYDSTTGERGTLELSLESVDEGGLKLVAENHDGDSWESKEFDPVETIIKIFKSSNEEERKNIMAVDFSAFDSKVDLAALQEEVENAPETEFEDAPDGIYVVSVEKMEVKLTNAKDKLMFAVQMKIKEALDKDGDSVETNQKGRMIFFNRVISGNSSPKWTDGQAIKSVVTWVNKLLGDDAEAVEFVNYSDFAEQVLDVFQEIKDAIEVEVDYAAKRFNPVSIKEVYDL